MTPDFVVAGHIVKDIIEGGWRPGGTVTFAAVQAHHLGLRPGIVTRAAAEVDLRAFFPFAEIAAAPSRETTTFENVYAAEGRRQRVHAQAAPIAPADVPEAWRETPIVLSGPVLGEAGPGFGATFGASTLRGVSAQGWLRALDAEGHVVRMAWEGPPFWTDYDALFVSDEDLAGDTAPLEIWTRSVKMVAVTESQRGARVWADGQWRRIDAFPEDEVDPTGAGDTFATAFLIRFHETGDAGVAARFAAAAASLSVRGAGADAIATREEIEARMREHPEVALR